VDHAAIPLVDDGRVHDVRIVMGLPAGQPSRTLASNVSRY
jgi:hypothetical protein